MCSKTLLGIGLPSAALNASNVELVTTLLGDAFQAATITYLVAASVRAKIDGVNPP